MKWPDGAFSRLKTDYVQLKQINDKMTEQINKLQAELEIRKVRTLSVKEKEVIYQVMASIKSFVSLPKMFGIPSGEQEVLFLRSYDALMKKFKISERERKLRRD